MDAMNLVMRRSRQQQAVGMLSGAGLGAFDWSGLIKQGFDFGKSFVTSKYAKDAAKYTGLYLPSGAAQVPTQQPPQNANQNPYGVPPGSNVSTGLSQGFQNLAAQFGVSSSTLMILIIILVYFWMKPSPKVR